MTFLEQLESAVTTGRKLFALLIDPDRNDEATLRRNAAYARQSGADVLLVGSSILLEKGVDECLRVLKACSDLPVFLFPGNSLQLSNKADGILLLSLISGRNADLLIGQHVIAAPFLKNSGIEVLPTGYLLIDSGAPTSASYMSQTLPVPGDKADIAAATAMAGELLGLRAIYLDAGSGAKYSVRAEMIRKVRASIRVPLIVGGGIRTPEKVAEIYEAGADMVVVGNLLEEDPESLFALTDAAKSFR
jgi:putative glycerol-1-phosphate prenyltransferase